MRRLASILVPVLALSACYSGYRGSGPESSSYRYSSDRWYDAADVPLAARIDQSGIGLGVQLNRPAYVAMFEIQPGQGVGLYYPAFNAEEGYFPMGFSRLPTHGARRFDSYFTGSQSRYSRGEPRFYFLVASRQPLRSIARFQHSDGALRSVLGLSAYSAANYRRVMDDLVQAVVPMQDDNDWTTDVLAVWPRNDSYYADNGGYQRVYCRDGTVEILPIELARFGCVRVQRPVVIRAPRVATQPPANGDSTSVRPPSRRRPEPAAAGGGEAGAEEAETGARAVPRRRPEPRVAEPAAPSAGSAGGATSPAEGDGGDGTRSRPRVDSPRSEPRESPRAEPRTEPRREAPRPEPVRSEPTRTESPRPAPVRESAPAPAPAPRSESPRSEGSRPERPTPVAPPAGR